MIPAERSVFWDVIVSVTVTKEGSHKQASSYSWFHFRHVLNVVCFLPGNSPASEFYMPTFRNILFHLHRQVGVKIELGLRNVGAFTVYKEWYQAAQRLRNTGISSSCGSHILITRGATLAFAWWNGGKTTDLLLWQVSGPIYEPRIFHIWSGGATNSI